MLAIFFENLSNYSQSSASVVLHISSITNTFLALCVALMIGKRHFAIATTHVAFVNIGVACEILRSDNQECTVLTELVLSTLVSRAPVFDSFQKV